MAGLRTTLWRCVHSCIFRQVLAALLSALEKYSCILILSPYPSSHVGTTKANRYVLLGSLSKPPLLFDWNSQVRGRQQGEMKSTQCTSVRVALWSQRSWIRTSQRVRLCPVLQSYTSMAWLRWKSLLLRILKKSWRESLHFIFERGGLFNKINSESCEMRMLNGALLQKSGWGWFFPMLGCCSGIVGVYNGSRYRSFTI